MPGRRLILLLVLLVLTLSVLSATRDISRRPATGAGDNRTTRPDATTAPAVTATTTPATPEPVRPAATLPSAKPVLARQGDRVILKVRSERPDVVLIDELGLRAPVGPGTTGLLDFVAGVPGSFAVELALGDRQVGEVEVEARRSGR